MSAKQNTLLTVAELSLRLARRYMQPYSHAKSPHKFTQAQWMACLILRTYLKTTYWGAIEVKRRTNYFQTRSDRQRKKYVKLSVCVLCGTSLVAY
jgi:hypothetical protein